MTLRKCRVSEGKEGKRRQNRYRRWKEFRKWGKRKQVDFDVLFPIRDREKKEGKSRGRLLSVSRPLIPTCFLPSAREKMGEKGNPIERGHISIRHSNARRPAGKRFKGKSLLSPHVMRLPKPLPLHLLQGGGKGIRAEEKRDTLCNPFTDLFSPKSDGRRGRLKGGKERAQRPVAGAPMLFLTPPSPTRKKKEREEKSR